MSALIADSSIPFVVQRMEVEDIPGVMAIERDSFPLPWSAAAYRHELTQNEHSHYVVVRRRMPSGLPTQNRLFYRWLKRRKSHLSPMVGYGGFWVLGEEAHISTIAVRPDWRGCGIGELLLEAMIDLASSLKAEVITLEVRVSNLVAQNLYRKYLFKSVGYRRRYYRDNDEDALIMTTPFIDSPVFRERYRQHRAALFERLRHLVVADERKRS